MSFRHSRPLMTAAAALLILQPLAAFAQATAAPGTPTTMEPAANTTAPGTPDANTVPGTTTMEAPASTTGTDTLTSPAPATGTTTTMPMDSAPATDAAPATGSDAAPMPMDAASTPAPASPEPATPAEPAATPATDAAAPMPTPAASTAAPAATDATMEKGTPTAEMQAVLDKLTDLGAKPIGTVSPEEQRQSPTPADAVMAVMKDKNIPMDPALAAVKTKDLAYPTAGGEQPVRIYTPEGAGPFPLIVYYHGGGWVIADLDTYDGSARALAAGSGAIVASVEYRHAPEAKFPAQHEDANAAYAWLIENSGSFNADAGRVALAGESAGGNLALNVAINARDNKLTQPRHILSVYPIAGHQMDTPSYVTYAEAMPLSKPAMEWFAKNVFPSMADAADPRIDLKTRTDLAGLPPVTIVNAQIDPLLSDGTELAANLEKQGVTVDQSTVDGVTHEFFGMGAVVPEAKTALDKAAAGLKAALAN